MSLSQNTGYTGQTTPDLSSNPRRVRGELVICTEPPVFDIKRKSTMCLKFNNFNDEARGHPKSFDYHNVDFYQQTLTGLCLSGLEVLTPRTGQLLTDYLTTGAGKLAMF